MPKISQLPILTNINTGSIIPIVDNSKTQKISVGKLYEFLSGTLDQTFSTEFELMQSASAITSSINTLSASFNQRINDVVIGEVSIPNGTISSSNQITALGFVTTGSNTFTQSQTISAGNSLLVNRIENTTGGNIEIAATGLLSLSGDGGGVTTNDNFEANPGGNATFKVISGSVIVTGSIRATGTPIVSSSQQITNFGFATTSSVLNIDTSSLVTTSSFNTFTSSLNSTFATDLEVSVVSGAIATTTGILQNSFTTTSSFNSYTASINSLTSSLVSKTGSYATTGSNTFIGNQTISGSIDITGAYKINGVNVLTGSQLSVDSITFDRTAGVSVLEGQMAWNNSDGTLDIGLNYGDVVLQVGQEQHFVVRNATGTTISNGTAVYASGLSAGSKRIEVSPFTANGTTDEVRFLGLATHNISDGVNGVVTNFGYVRGLDTRGTSVTAISVGDETWAEGDILYAHPTVAGKLTKVAPKEKITVAMVTTRHQTTGVLFVRPSSFGHIDDLHDVQINTGSLVTGSILEWNGDYFVNNDTFSSSVDIRLDTLENSTGSFATTGSNQFNGNQTITGSLVHGIAGNKATGEQSHAEGEGTQAIGNISHAEGLGTIAYGNGSHAEGQDTIASGSHSHAEGNWTIALADHQHVQGKYNLVSSAPAAFIVGNGTDAENRSNLIHAAGNEVQITGSIVVSGSIVGANNLITTSSFNTFTSSYKTDSASFDSRIGLGGSVPAGTVSSSIQITNFGFATTSSILSVDTSSLVTTSSFNSFTASVIATGSLTNTFTSSINTFTASVRASGSIINTFTSSVNTFSASVNSKTGSYATTGSNSFTGSQNISGSLTVASVFTISASINANSSSLTLNSGSNLYIQNNGYFELSGSSLISGSLTVIGTTNLVTTSSFIAFTSSVNTTTASLNSKTGSYATTGSNIFNGSQTISGSLSIAGAGGDEGGEIQLELAQTNTTLTGSIVFDVYTDKLRLFEGGGNNRGAFLNISSQSNGVSSEIVTSTTVSKIETISSASYAALNPPVSGTLYIII